MTFDAILNAPPAILVHLGAGLLALAIGPLAIYRRRRDRWHRWLGRLWVAAMAVLALSGLIVPAVVLPIIGSFGVIHLLSIWVLLNLIWGVRAILHRRVAQHQATMRSLYWQGLTFAGLLTLLPGRRLNALIFGPAETAAYWVIGGIGLLAALLWVRRRAQKPIL